MEAKRITKTRITFLRQHPFLAVLALKLIVKENKDVPTMGTDGRYLYYNSDFVKSLKDEQLLGINAHEVSHCLFRHCGLEGIERMVGKQEDVWMAAAEYIANYFVIDLCGLKLTNGALYDKKYSDGKWTTEAIYYDLLKQSKKQKIQIIDDHSKWGNFSAQEGKKIDMEWKLAIAQAADFAKRQGKLPAGLERLIGEILDPQLPWQYILAEFVSGQSKDDYTWRKQNKRHFHLGYITPAIYSEKLVIGYATDTSGSMSEKELAEGLSELIAICNAFPSYELHLFACDAAVHHYQVITQMDGIDGIDIKGMIKGGGGTDFRPVFEKINEDNIQLSALVYFTDAYGTFPDEEPDFPVLWVVKGNREVPWGRRCEL